MNDKEKIEFIELAIKDLFKKDIKINPKEKLIELGLDSLDTVELQMYYEDRAKVVIESDESPLTVQDLMNMMI